MQQCIVLLLSLIVVGGIVALGRSPGVGSMQWAYEIGSQPFYRLLFLLVVLVVASQAHFFSSPPVFQVPAPSSPPPYSKKTWR